MNFRVLIFCAFRFCAFGQTTLSTGDDVSELKAMMTALQQEVAAIHNHILSHQSLSIDQICKNFTKTVGPQPKDCLDILKDGHTQSGVYTVTPPGLGAAIQVYCDQTTSTGGWLLIQKRNDGKVDFHKTYTEYEAGFGNLTDEHWLGNRNIHAITSSGKYELLVELEDFQSHVKTAHYNAFSVGDQASHYTLTVSGFNGTAGDSMIFDHNGHQFSTYDSDHDGAANVNCADRHGGGYWYSNCFKSNLNGKWGVPGDKGIVWGSFKDWQMYVLKRTEMKIRPVKTY